MFNFYKKPPKPEQFIEAIFELFTPEEVKFLRTKTDIDVKEKLLTRCRNKKPRFRTLNEAQEVMHSYIKLMRTENQIPNIESNEILIFYDTVKERIFFDE